MTGRLVTLEQGSPDWALWRSAGLGASDAPMILGESPYGDRETLMREKLGVAKRDNNFAMRRGNRLEPVACGLYALTRLHPGQPCEPCCVVHPTLDWLRASLDGLVEGVDAGGEVTGPAWAVEVKCWAWPKHDLVLQGMLPREVVGQLQQQLLVTGLGRVDLVSYSGGGRFGDDDRLAVLTVAADWAYQARLLEAAGAFWREYLERAAALGAGKAGAA